MQPCIHEKSPATNWALNVTTSFLEIIFSQITIYCQLSSYWMELQQTPTPYYYFFFQRLYFFHCCSPTLRLDAIHNFFIIIWHEMYHKSWISIWWLHRRYIMQIFHVQIAHCTKRFQNSFTCPFFYVQIHYDKKLNSFRFHSTHRQNLELLLSLSFSINLGFLPKQQVLSSSHFL